MEPSLKCSRNHHEVIDQWSVRPTIFFHSSVLTHWWFQFAIISEGECQCFKSSHRGSSRGLVPWGFRRRAPAVLRTHSWRHCVVLFWSIDEDWWAWPPLTVTCTVLSRWDHVLSMIHDALKPCWNWTRSVGSNVALGSRRIGLGADATICFTLADDPALSYFWRAWHDRKPPSVDLPREAHHERVPFQTCNSPQWDLFARRCHVDVAVTMELVSMQTPNHEDCGAIDIRALSHNSESVKWWRRCPFGPCVSWHPENCFLL